MTGAEKNMVVVVIIVNADADTEPAPPLEPSRKVSVQVPLACGGVSPTKPLLVAKLLGASANGPGVLGKNNPAGMTLV